MPKKAAPRNRGATVFAYCGDGLFCLLHTEPVHGASQETTLVERAAYLQYVALYLHGAVVGLAIAWIVDGATAVLIAHLLEIGRASCRERVSLGV